MELAPGQRRSVPDNLKMSKIYERLLAPNCSEIIDVYRYTRQFLYRGMKTDKNMFRGTSRPHREPRDSSPDMTEIFDEMLRINGMEVVRSNSYFATSDLAHAREFGTVFIIFPVNGFKFTYTNEPDLILDNWRKLIDPKMMEQLDKAYKAAKLAQRKAVLYATNWITDGDEILSPAQALERLKSISDDKWVHSLTADDLFDPAAFNERYKPDNTEIEWAIQKENEVMMQGQYYAFNIRYGEALAEMVFKK